MAVCYCVQSTVLATVTGLQQAGVVANRSRYRRPTPPISKTPEPPPPPKALYFSIATRLGGKVVAVDRGKDRLDICRQLGAVATIDFDTEDVKDRIKEITGSVSEQALRLTRWGGPFTRLSRP